MALTRKNGVKRPCWIAAGRGTGNFIRASSVFGFSYALYFMSAGTYLRRYAII
jgi:hypothetical protein